MKPVEASGEIEAADVALLAVGEVGGRGETAAPGGSREIELVPLSPAEGAAPRGPRRGAGGAALGRAGKAATGLLLLGLWALPAEATTVGGGGSKKTDCLAVFETSIGVAASQRKLVCADGDPACDADLAVDGQCTFSLAVCTNSSFEPRCTPSGVESIFIEHSADNGDPDFDPDFQALQDRIDNELDLPSSVPECTGASFVTVRVKGPFPGNRCRSNQKKLRMTTRSEFDVAAGKTFVDRDTIRFVCQPAAVSCDPRDLFSGTFERIQWQIFDQRCAVSACHDSQSLAGNLLLETGASYPSTVGVAPANFAASELGWLRVAPGEPERSYLYRKVEGELGLGLGERMPLGRRKLKGFLREILRLWIEGGAPSTGWVPGTD